MAKLMHIHVDAYPALVGTAEIAELANVRVNTVNQWQHRGLLPAPVAELSCGRVWRKDQVVAWLKTRKGTKA
jgi:phage terminase Nu1 subunit (DNA packaging protein)